MHLIKKLVVFLLFSSSFYTHSSEGKSEVDVRSGFLARLPGVIYWPKTSDFHQPDSSYRLCVYRDRDYYLYAKEFLKSTTVAQKSIDIRFTRKLEDLKNCHVSYVGAISRVEIESLNSLDVLTKSVLVASSEFSAKLGIHVRLYIDNAGQSQLEINRDAFEASGSGVQVAVLKLAKKVYDKSPNNTNGVIPVNNIQLVNSGGQQ